MWKQLKKKCGRTYAYEIGEGGSMCLVGGNLFSDIQQMAHSGGNERHRVWTGRDPVSRCKGFIRNVVCVVLSLVSCVLSVCMYDDDGPAREVF